MDTLFPEGLSFGASPTALPGDQLLLSFFFYCYLSRSLPQTSGETFLSPAGSVPFSGSPDVVLSFASHLVVIETRLVDFLFPVLCFSSLVEASVWLPDSSTDAG